MVVAINRNQKHINSSTGSRRNNNNYAVFNTGFISRANFNDVVIEGVPETLVKSALAAVVGKFKDSGGTEHEFTDDRLNNIASATNTYLSTGGILPVCTDHQKNVANTVGNIGGEAYTKVIEAKDLPNPKATHLLGKLGLFFSDVIIKSRDAIEKVRDGIVTSVSMGLNLDPDDHRVVELSLVPIAAIPNMGLFGYNPTLASMSFGLPQLSNYAYPNVNANKTDAFTWEDLESNEQSLDDLKEEFDGLTEDLWILLNNIYNSSAIEITDISVLQQYVFTALNGFSQRVVDTLGLTNATDPNASTGADPSTQTATDVQQSNDIKYQDLASAGNTGVQYKYHRNNIATFGNVTSTKVKYLTNKYLSN